MFWGEGVEERGYVQEGNHLNDSFNVEIEKVSCVHGGGGLAIKTCNYFYGTCLFFSLNILFN